MRTTRYRESKAIPLQSLLDLYNDAGWQAYTHEPEVLQQAMENSLCVISAYDGERLTGLVRVVGDGHTIVYIQDILVLHAYKRKGIGSALLNRVIKKYHHVRQKVLLTDDNTETRGFYEAMGFEPCGKSGLLAFVKLKNKK